MVAVVYLIGDAGFPAPGGEPVLEALKQDILETAGSEQRVVFLGDNIYPSGMPPVGEGRDDRTKRAEAERRSLAQVEVGLATTTPMVFVPGNHDWDPYNGTGRDAVLRQEAFVESAGGELVAWLPDGGCPGPDVHDLNDSIRLVVLDTEWWLRSEGKPTHPTSDCPADSESEIVEQLADVLRRGERHHVIVVAHHPLATGGPHGGHFSIGQHIFPLRDWHRWLWVPLPIVGSVYPIARKLGVRVQDMSGSRNRAMRAALDSVLAVAPPLLYASGHSHTLEVLDGGSRAGALVVSGAGTFGDLDQPAELEETLFRAPGSAGYVRLDFERSGRVRLSVVTVDRMNQGTEAYATYIAAPS